MHFLFGLYLFYGLAFAHQSSLTSQGSPFFWASSSIPIHLDLTTSDMSTGTAQSIVQNSINQWNSASGTSIFSTSVTDNTIQFTNNFSAYGSAVIGITEISYDSDGEIKKANIFLNDNYLFKSTSGHYSGNSVFLGDVVSHELGHFLGLSHSEVLDSTMFYSAFSGQNTLSLDDKAAVISKYGPISGTIYGYIKGGRNVGVIGSHVQAISRNTGESVSTISLEGGYFEIKGLPLNDTYYLYNSPIKNLSSLPAHFGNVQNSFCPGAYVGSFFNSCDKENEGFPNGITLTPTASSLYVGTVTINCSLKANEEYGLQKLISTFDPITLVSTFDPIKIIDFSSVNPKYEQAFVGYFPTSLTGTSAPDIFEVDLTEFNQLTTNAKQLKVSLVSQNLGTQLGYSLKIKQNGNYIASADRTMEYSLVTQTYEVDIESYLPLSSIPAQNIFQIEVRGSKLISSVLEATFPSFSTFTNSNQSPYLLITGITEFLGASYTPLLNTQQLLSDNASCLDAPFTYPVTKAQVTEESSSKSTDAGVGCGTVEPPSQGGGNGPTFYIMTLGFFLAVLGTRTFKRAKNFLS